MRHSWLTKRIHISWLLAAASLGIIIGAALAPAVDFKFNDASWLVIAVSLFLTVSMNRRVYIVVLAIMAGSLVGLYRGSVTGMAISEYSTLYGQQVVVKGHVNDDTSYGPRGDQRLRIDKVVINEEEYTSTVWVSFRSDLDIKRGDNVEVRGVLTKGFGNTPAAIYRAEINDVKRPVPGDIGRQVRDWFGEGVSKTMSQSDANFALAFLLGQKLALPDGLSEQLRTVGLIHAVVASGYHLTVLVGVVRRLFEKVSKYLTLVFSVSVTGGFMLITGFSPSMTRAGLVTSLSLVAWYYGRLIHPIVLLLCAAGLTVIYRPSYAWGDVGWLLSFAAFSGVLVLSPLLNHYFWGRSRPSILREVLIATVAAQLMTLPITMYVFGYYSIYALLANLLVVPIIPVIMLLTFMSGLFGLMILPVGKLFGWITEVLLTYVIQVTEWIVALPASRTELSISLGLVVGSYVLIGMLAGFLWKKTGHDFKNSRDSNNLF